MTDGGNRFFATLRSTQNDKSPLEKGGGGAGGFSCLIQHYGKRIFLQTQNDNIITYCHSERNEAHLTRFGQENESLIFTQKQQVIN